MIDVDWGWESKDITIPFYRWNIVVTIGCGEDSTHLNDICVFDRQSEEEVTEEFLQFNQSGHINPTGDNLFQVMDILKTNYDRAIERIKK